MPSAAEAAVTTGPDRVFIHADLDCFFVAVEVLDNPKLAGKPVAVGGTRGRGVVTSCSYEARAYGVRSAMPMSRALALCPMLIAVRGHHARYGEMSTRVFEVMREFTPAVEPLSIDEAFLDITGSLKLFGSPEAIGRQLRERVREKTGLVISVGVATSKFVAKVASDLGKPDGLTVAPTDPAALAEWLAPLPIRRMWGVGKKTEPRVQGHGFYSFRDLQQASEVEVRDKLGDHGLAWRERAFGRDARRVRVTRSGVKSISNESTFAADMADRDFLESALSALSDSVASRAPQQRDRRPPRDAEGAVRRLPHDHAGADAARADGRLRSDLPDGLGFARCARHARPAAAAGRRPIGRSGVARAVCAAAARRLGGAGSEGVR
jgi:DNA polymerase-4